jgi:hypothetical protein
MSSGEKLRRETVNSFLKNLPGIYVSRFFPCAICTPTRVVKISLLRLAFNFLRFHKGRGLVTPVDISTMLINKI